MIEQDGGGTPTPPSRREEIKEFLRQVIALETDDCILWPYALHRKRYGAYRNRASPTGYAHIYVCNTVHGPKPDASLEVRHLCGNPQCINHRHLRWGTREENQADRKLHGTAQYGEANPYTKLTEADVREIKKRLRQGEQQKSIAASFGVHKTTISYIARNKTWTHVE